MSRVTIRKWGNSAGIRIPNAELKSANAHIGEAYDLRIEKSGRIILEPVIDSSADWEAAFNAIADAKEDSLIIETLQTEFDKDEWKW